MEKKNPEGIFFKPKSIFVVEVKLGLEQNSNMSEEVRQICSNAIRNSCNKGQKSQQSIGFSNYNNSTSNGNNQQSKLKKDKKKKENVFKAIKCWFCHKTGHT